MWAGPTKSRTYSHKAKSREARINFRPVHAMKLAHLCVERAERGAVWPARVSSACAVNEYVHALLHNIK